MTAVELLRARIEALVDRPHWHDGHIPAADAREAILAALDEPLPEEGLRCTCPHGSDAIGPHTRGCPNHPESAR